MGGLPADPIRGMRNLLGVVLCGRAGGLGTLSRDPAPCCASTTGAKLESLEMEVLGEGPPSRNVLQRGQAEPHGPGLGTSKSSLNLRY